MWPENFGGHTGKWTDWLPVGLIMALFLGIVASTPVVETGAKNLCRPDSNYHDWLFPSGGAGE